MTGLMTTTPSMWSLSWTSKAQHIHIKWLAPTQIHIFLCIVYFILAKYMYMLLLVHCRKFIALKLTCRCTCFE